MVRRRATNRDRDAASRAPRLCGQLRPRRFLALLLVAVGAVLAAHAQQTAVFMGAQSTIATVAGGNPVRGVAVDAQGNLWVTTSASSGVFEIEAVNGVLPASPTVLGFAAGNFINPAGLAFDSAGNLWVADPGDGAIKEIVASGGAIPSIPTVNSVVSGFGTPWGLAFDSAGDLWIADYGSDAVEEIAAVNGSIPASPAVTTVSSDFDGPQGVWVDSRGNVFVADTDGGNVDEMAGIAPPAASAPPANNNIVITVLGNVFSRPSSVAVDASGNVWVTDSNNRLFREIVAVNGSIPSSPSILSVAAGSLGYGPLAVTVDARNNVYYAAGQGSVYQLQPAPDLGQVYVGQGASPALLPTSASASLLFGFMAATTIGAPWVETQGTGYLDFTDMGGGSCDTNGTSYSYQAGDTCTVHINFQPIHAGRRSGAVQLTQGGNILATGSISGVGVAPLATFLDASAGSQVTNILPSGYKNGVTCIAVDGYENIFYSVLLSDTVYELPWNGSSYGTPVDIGAGEFGSSVLGCVVDGAGNVFAGDNANSRIMEIPRGGTGFGIPFSVVDLSSIYGASTNLAIDGAGNLFFSSYYGGGAYEAPLTSSGYGAPIQLPFSQTLNAYGIALDTDGDVFVTDEPHGTILELPKTVTGWGQLATVASGLTIGPGLQVDAAGDLFVGQVNAPPIELPWNGATFDPQVPVYPYLAQKPDPNDFVFDSKGNLFEADAEIAIDELDWVDPPSLTFESTAVGSTSADSPQSVAVRNIGNAPLLLAGGTNPDYPADFPEHASAFNLCTAGQSLSFGLYCYVSIDFKPANTGLLNEYVALDDNNLYLPGGAAHDIGVSGTATGGNPITPTIDWAPATVIPYGTALGSGDFSAVAMVGTTNVSADGAFSYYVGFVGGTPVTPSTILPGGSDTLCVQWTPLSSYTSQYNSASLCVPITVLAATTSINWTPASPINYPAPLGSGQFNAAAMAGATTVSSDGTFTYYVGSVGGTVATTATVLPVGVDPLCVQWKPSSSYTADYISSSLCVNITVNAPAQVADSETITVNDSEALGAFTLPPAIAVNAPVAYFSVGTPLGFGGVAGSQQAIAVSNIGQAAMTLASVKLASGTAFSLSALQCFNGATTTKLPKNGFCVLTITYTGSAPASDTDTLTFTDNAELSNLTTAGSSPNFTQSIVLTGTGGITAPPPAPPATDPLSDAETVTVNDSEALGAFTLPPAIAVNAPVAYFSVGTPLGFGGKAGSQQAIAVSNIGKAPMTLASVKLASGTAFSLSALQCFNGATTTKLPKNGFCVLTITYTGSAPASDTDTLTFTDNAELSNLTTAGSSPNFTQSIVLTGTGGITAPPPAPSATDPLSDAETVTVNDSEALGAFTLPPAIAVNAPVAYFSVGTPLGFGGKAGSQQTIAVSNIGQAAMTLASVKLASGTAFSLSALQCFNGATTTKLPKNGFCVLTITYTGAKPATDSDTLTFTDNAELSNLTTAGSSPNFTQSIGLTGTGGITAPPPAPSATDPLSDAETVTVNDSEALGAFTLPPAIAVNAPVAYFSAGTPLGFGGKAGSQQTIAVSNIGQAAMTLASVKLASGTAFSLSALQCFNGATTTKLPKNGFCVLTITYTGSAPASDSDTLTFTDNAELSNLTTAGSSPNFTQSIVLTGTGGITAPPAAPSATVSVSDTETVTVNDGEAVGDFTLSPAIPVNAPVAYFSAGTPLGFGGKAGSQQTIGVSNIGQAAMTLASVKLASGTVFSLSALQCFNGATATTLPTSGFCVLTITYTGAKPATDSDTLTFTDNAELSNLTTAGSSPNFTQSIVLTGTGGITAPPPAPPATVSVSDAETIAVNDSDAVGSFALSPIDVTAPVAYFSAGTPLGFGGKAGSQQAIAVSNIGKAPMTLASVKLASGTAFSLSALQCFNGATASSLPTSSACELTITYTGKSPATDTDTLTFTDNAELSNLATTGSSPNFTQSIVLTGTGGITAPPAAPPATVSVSDAETVTVSDRAKVTMSLVITTGLLQPGIEGGSYSQMLQAAGGSGAGYNWTIAQGSLPGGLALSPGGIISGAPDTAGTSTFTVQVTDSQKDTFAQTLSLTIDPALSISPARLPAGTAETTYALTLSASGGSGSGYSWSMTSPLAITSLSAIGLSLSSTGAFSGTALAGQATFAVQVRDSQGNAATAQYQVTINKAPATVMLSDTTQTYTGSPLAVTVATTPTGLATSCTYGGSSTAPVSAGTYPVVCTVNNANYQGSVNGTFAIINPVPLIASTSPAYVTAGGSDFTLTVTGSGFTPSSTLYWGTTQLASTPVTGLSTQLEVQVPASEIAKAGTAAITVQTPAPGGGNSNSWQFEISPSGNGAGKAPIITTITGTVTPGESASYAVKLPSGATKVSVQCLNLPLGLACSYVNGTLTITTSSNTPAGTYTIVVVFTYATSGGTSSALILLPLLLLPLALARRRWTKAGIAFVAVMVLVLFGVSTQGCTAGPMQYATSTGQVTLIVQ